MFFSFSLLFYHYSLHPLLLSFVFPFIFFFLPLLSITKLNTIFSLLSLYYAPLFFLLLSFSFSLPPQVLFLYPSSISLFQYAFICSLPSLLPFLFFNFLYSFPCRLVFSCSLAGVLFPHFVNITFLKRIDYFSFPFFIIFFFLRSGSCSSFLFFSTCGLHYASLILYFALLSLFPPPFPVFQLSCACLSLFLFPLFFSIIMCNTSIFLIFFLIQFIPASSFLISPNSPSSLCSLFLFFSCFFLSLIFRFFTQLLFFHYFHFSVKFSIWFPFTLFHFITSTSLFLLYFYHHYFLLFFSFLFHL